ncbi:O-antigen ligase family protein [Erythrobacter sp. MTPC3]|uniref:O-antigen ligase family protein n=1 Tax=Erythrobacter sp. MTPC3 TaxID=3056564 RepID=UPI0036F275C7
MRQLSRSTNRKNAGGASQLQGFGLDGAIALAVLVLLAVLLGGGGVRYALSNLAVQIAALTALALNRDAVLAFIKTAPTFLRILVAFSLLLPTLQLIPLPESIWSSLPGRELVAASFELTGRTGFAPMTVDPVRTAVAFTALIVPIAILCGGWEVPRPQLILLGWVFVALALLNIVISVPQLMEGGRASLLYPELGDRTVLNGTFANRNSTGLFLVSAMALAATLPVPRKLPAVIAIRMAICLLLLTGVILTQSRTALVLAALPLAFAATIGLMRIRVGTLPATPNFVKISIAVGVLLAIGVAAAIAINPGRIGTTLERFNAANDARQYTWEDSSFSASRYWPVGAGMGTFDEVFQVDESLENSTVRRPGRAHNDYLEIAIEAGAAGLLLTAFWIVLIAWLSWRIRRSELRWMGWAGAIILAAIALQSITDYPLRNLSIFSLASFATLILARISADPDGEHQ